MLVPITIWQRFSLSLSTKSLLIGDKEGQLTLFITTFFREQFDDSRVILRRLFYPQ